MKKPKCGIKNCEENAFCSVGEVWLCMKHLLEYDKKKKEMIRKQILGLMEEK